MARFTACEHCGELLMENGRNWIHADGFFTCLAAPGHSAVPIDRDAAYDEGWMACAAAAISAVEQ